MGGGEEKNEKGNEGKWKEKGDVGIRAKIRNAAKKPFYVGGHKRFAGGVTIQKIAWRVGCKSSKGGERWGLLPKEKLAASL